MRILIINDFIRKVGGAETFVYSLKEHLEERGHTVDIFGSTEGEDRASLISRWYSLKWYKKTVKKINEFKPDIIHVNNVARIVSPSVIKAGLNNNVPVVVTLHDYHLFCPRLLGLKDNDVCEKGFGLRCIYSNCQSFKGGWKRFPIHLLKLIRVKLHRKMMMDKRIKIISPSRDLANRINKSAKINVDVLRYGIDIPAEATNYKKNILFVGRISKEKGLHKVAHILNRVKNYNVIVVGDGEYYKSLKAKYNNINFVGFKDNPQQYYKNAILSIVPSLWLENFPLSILESMSYGLCVLSSNRGGIPEQVINRTTGRLFDPNKEDDFRRILKNLLDNPEEMKELGKCGRQEMIDKLAWEKIIVDYENLYKKMMEAEKNTK